MVTKWQRHLEGDETHAGEVRGVREVRGVPFRLDLVVSRGICGVIWAGLSRFGSRPASCAACAVGAILSRHVFQYWCRGNATLCRRRGHERRSRTQFKWDSHQCRQGRVCSPRQTCAHARDSSFAPEEQRSAEGRDRGEKPKCG